MADVLRPDDPRPDELLTPSQALAAKQVRDRAQAPTLTEAVLAQLNVPAAQPDGKPLVSDKKKKVALIVPARGRQDSPAPRPAVAAPPPVRAPSSATVAAPYRGRADDDDDDDSCSTLPLRPRPSRDDASDSDTELDVECEPHAQAARKRSRDSRRTHTSEELPRSVLRVVKSLTHATHSVEHQEGALSANLSQSELVASQLSGIASNLQSLHQQFGANGIELSANAQQMLASRIDGVPPVLLECLRPFLNELHEGNMRIAGQVTALPLAVSREDVGNVLHEQLELQLQAFAQHLAATYDPTNIIAQVSALLQNPTDEAHHTLMANVGLLFDASVARMAPRFASLVKADDIATALIRMVPGLQTPPPEVARFVLERMGADFSHQQVIQRERQLLEEIKSEVVSTIQAQAPAHAVDAETAARLSQQFASCADQSIKNEWDLHDPILACSQVFSRVAQDIVAKVGPAFDAAIARAATSAFDLDRLKAAFAPVLQEALRAVAAASRDNAAPSVALVEEMKQAISQAGLEHAALDELLKDVRNEHCILHAETESGLKEARDREARTLEQTQETMVQFRRLADRVLECSNDTRAAVEAKYAAELAAAEAKRLPVVAGAVDRFSRQPGDEPSRNAEASTAKAIAAYACSKVIQSRRQRAGWVHMAQG